MPLRICIRFETSALGNINAGTFRAGEKPVSDVNRQWIFTRAPDGAVTPDIFERREAPVPDVGPGEVLVRTRLLSLDPANRAWMRGRTYREQVMPGDVMHGFTIGEVVASNASGFEAGDLVEGMNGWQDYASVKPGSLTKRDAGRDPLHMIGVLSITGLTAYHGLFDIGRPVPGDTVLVSAAAGAVGTIVGQLARLAGCRTVGIAGGADKCDWLVRELGFDAAVDYKAADFRKSLRAACPSGVDIYFDNVGGQILDAALAAMKIGGRVVCCGAVANYDVGTVPYSSPALPGVLVAKRLRMEGFIVLDYAARRAEAEQRLAGWVESGAVRAIVDVVDGLEQAPAALVRLLDGGNRGKMAVRIS